MFGALPHCRALGKGSVDFALRNHMLWRIYRSIAVNGTAAAESLNPRRASACQRCVRIFLPSGFLHSFRFLKRRDLTSFSHQPDRVATCGKRHHQP